MSATGLAAGGTSAGGTVTVRRGAATFAGAVVAAASGFLLALLVGRSLGAAGAGVFFSIVSLFTITSSVLKLGADTAQLWRMPRLLVEGRLAEIRPTLALALLPSIIAGVVAAVVLVVLAQPIAERLNGAALELGVATQVLWAAGGLVFMAPMAILVAATRGFGLVKPFVLVQNVGLPVGRLVAVAAVLAGGAGGVAVMAAWSIPVLVAFLLAAYLLGNEVRRVLGGAHEVVPARPPRVLARQLWGFAAPRGVTATLEAVLVAVNTLIVGLALGPAAAGVFGVLSRYVTTGALAQETVRILVAPRFSALLAARDLATATRLYSATTPWIVLASWPVFVTLAAGAPAWLALFGPGFGAGADALAVLAVTLCLAQLAGNVQTILLMSGRSRLQLVNKVTAVLVLLGLHAVLIPRWGLMGAALAWSASILVDTGMALAEVRWLVGLRLRCPMRLRLALVSAVTFGVPTALLVRPDGRGLGALAAALAVGVALYLPVIWLWRRRLNLTATPAGLSVEQAGLAGAAHEPGNGRG